MGIAVWAALRQLEALRESVAFTLEKGAFKYTHQYEIFREDGKLNTEGFAQWISDQGITPAILDFTDLETQEQIGEEEVNLLISMKNFLEEHCPSKRFEWEANYTSQNVPDFGVHRSGVGWHSLPNFIITSAFIRLLGASEQFELDVLKSLLYYRSGGKPEPSDIGDIITIASEILTEEPDESGAYFKPSIWTWIKKSAENNLERRKIFKQVYGIEATPEVFNGFNKNAINKYRNELYEKRNAIAHGRASVEMSLGDYCTAELFVIETIRAIEQQCLDKLGISL
jgi:hypothetical protein